MSLERESSNGTVSPFLHFPFDNSEKQSMVVDEHFPVAQSQVSVVHAEPSSHWRLLEHLPVHVTSETLHCPVVASQP